MNVLDIDTSSLSVLDIIRQALPGIERFIQETLVYESLSDSARLEWAVLIQHVTKVQHNKITLLDCFPPPNNSPDQTISTQGDSTGPHLEETSVSSFTTMLARNTNRNSIASQENNTISAKRNLSHPSRTQLSNSSTVTTTALPRHALPSTSISTPVTSSSNNFTIFSMPANEHNSSLLANNSIIPNTFPSFLGKTEEIPNSLDSLDNINFELLTALNDSSTLDLYQPINVPESPSLTDPENSVSSDPNFHLKRFQCTLCPKRFRRKQHLHQHLIIHSGDKPYHCSFCDRKFIYPSALRVHLKIHINPPHICQVCSQGFTLKSNLEKHMTKHNSKQIKAITCEHCTKKFINKRMLKLHNSKVHSTPNSGFQESITHGSTNNSSNIERDNQLGSISMVIGSETQARSTRNNDNNLFLPGTAKIEIHQDD